MVSRLAAPAPLRAALWMLLAGVSYVLSAALTRHLAGAYSVFELAFLRCLLALAFLAPMMARTGFAGLRTRQFPLHCLRTVLTYAAIVLWFYAVTVVPVADFFAIQFTTPLITIVLAVIFLGERTGLASWLATLAGFAGVLVILRPGLIEIGIGSLAALATSTAYAGVNTVIKVLSRRDSAAVIVIYVNLLILPLALVPALFDWRTPLPADVLPIIGIGLFSTLAQYSVARSISGADARVVQPVNFLRLPIAAAVGYFGFRELPDLWTWVGAVIIFLAAWYVVGREAR